MEDRDYILSKWLEGEVSDNEVEMLIGKQELDQLKQLLKVQENTQITAKDSESTWKDLESKLDNKKIRGKRRNIIIALALILLLSVLAYFTLNRVTTVHADQSEYINYALEDGSSIRLWPGSTLKYDEKSFLENRSVFLEGEAFFDVEKGESFAVETKAGTVEVLGTSFSVWVPERKAMIVKCNTGSVKVSDPSGAFRVLEPGEKVVIEDSKIGEKENFEVAIASANKSYDDAKASWVVADLEKILGISIKLDKGLQTQRFSGVISLEETSEALFYLCETMRWSYVIKDNIYVIRQKD